MMHLPKSSLFIAGPLLLFLAITGIVTFVYLVQSKNLSEELHKKIKENYRESKENELKYHINTAIGEITKLGLYKPDATDKEKSDALDVLKKLRHYHSEDGYYFVYEVINSNVIFNKMHPVFTDWEGTNRADELDCANNFVIRDLARIANKTPKDDEKDNRFFKYMFKKPSTQGNTNINSSCGNQKLKLGYVVMLEHWPTYMLGTGIYWDDAEKFLAGTNHQISNVIGDAMLLIAGVAGLSALIVGFLQMRIGKRIGRLIGKEKEKIRLITMLHDSVNQNLSFVVRALRNKLEENIEPTEKISIGHKDLEEWEKIASWALEDLFRIEEKGDMIAYPTLVNGLKAVIERIKVREKISIEFYPSIIVEQQTGHLSEEKKAALIGVAQEALNNIRHARTSQVEIQLNVVGSKIILDIMDNGCGMPDTIALSGIGLKNMKQNMQRVGGSLDIMPGLNSGTIVTAIVERDTKNISVDNKFDNIADQQYRTKTELKTMEGT
ncbi:MAG: cache domain-containing protein [Nitrosomonas sp.]|nr:cache domain-containing protein [Nitrosomonas sp.]